ncbi:adenylyltransferase/cytidyltransferase family protein [Patescibacteria group bacterium]|nr:adenylyltransferase/cytidyltransferase family protein [Patescibacteria group bacterium]
MSPKKIVYAYVVGDIVHIGHIRHLQNAKQQGDYLIVGVLTDKATMEKKSVPVVSFAERLEVIRFLKMVDEAIPQTTYSPLGNVQRIRPDILMESDSHPEQPANEFVYSYGGKVIITPYYRPQSSTKIKTKILKTWQSPVLTSTQSVSVTDK